MKIFLLKIIKIIVRLKIILLDITIAITYIRKINNINYRNQYIIEGVLKNILFTFFDKEIIYSH
jgi:hypothetical protein